MNWKYGVIIGFTLFAAFISMLVIKSMLTRIDMVTPDYYAEELQYQQVIDGRRHALALSAPVMVRQQDNAVELAFPSEMQGKPLKGTVLFYCAADSRKDVRLPLQPDGQGRLLIGRERFSPGSYRVKLQWEAGGAPYFQETSITIH